MDYTKVIPVTECLSVRSMCPIILEPYIKAIFNQYDENGKPSVPGPKYGVCVGGDDGMIRVFGIKVYHANNPTPAPDCGHDIKVLMEWGLVAQPASGRKNNKRARVHERLLPVKHI